MSGKLTSFGAQPGRLVIPSHAKPCWTRQNIPMPKYLMRSAASTSGWQASPALVCCVKRPAERQEWEHLKLRVQTLVVRCCLDIWRQRWVTLCDTFYNRTLCLYNAQIKLSHNLKDSEQRMAPTLHSGIVEIAQLYILMQLKRHYSPYTLHFCQEDNLQRGNNQPLWLFQL